MNNLERKSTRQVVEDAIDSSKADKTSRWAQDKPLLES